MILTFSLVHHLIKKIILVFLALVLQTDITRCQRDKHMQLWVGNNNKRNIKIISHSFDTPTSQKKA